jgi:predicted nucleotidyltransferase component of viral defense system
MAKQPKDIAASVRQRLLDIARSEGRVFDVVLVSFGLERLIYRLSISEHSNKFVLKGGMLVTLWTSNSGRFTRDVDFLGFGKGDETELKNMFGELLAIDADDGLIFDATNLNAAAIREDHIYGGMRLKTTAYLGKTKVPITIDVGFGDAITDPEYTINYPSLLDLPTGTIRAYSPATVMAEKFQALVSLGLANGRMKDFYDLWEVPRSTEITQEDLLAAVTATFERRETKVPAKRPEALTAAFTEDPVKKQQWQAYSESIDLEGTDLNMVTDAIWEVLGPVCERHNN